MKLIGGIVFHVFSNAVALLAAEYFVTGFTFSGDFIELLITAAVFTAINQIIKPLLKMFLGPFILLTFGLFIVVINAAVLYLLDLWSPLLTIEGYIPLLWGTLIIGAVNTFTSFGARNLYQK